MRRGLLAGLFVVSALVGCVDQPAVRYELGGTFTENATQAQMGELADGVQARGGTLHQLESFPVQFRARDLGPGACGEVRDLARGAAFVADVGECELEDAAGSGSEATSNGGG